MKLFKLLILLVLIVLPLSGCSLFKKKTTDQPPGTKKIERPVNQIPVGDRPYILLEPMAARNKLNLVIHDRKIAAQTVEVTLEYDRNEGVLDAVLKELPLTKVPQIEEIFLGSKSAGGHTTYHDDVIGGTIKLAFDGDNPYTLEVPWRYDDKQAEYDQVSTADGKFQAKLAQPLKSAKVVVMQSPGYPGEVKGDAIAGPYLIRGVGPLPTTSVNLTMRLNEDTTTAQLHGWDGSEWQELESKLDGKTLTATTPLLDLYVVTK